MQSPPDNDLHNTKVLRPLDANILLALVEDGNDAEDMYVRFVKESFERQDMSEGMVNLMMGFGFSRPYLRLLCQTWEHWPNKWRINFGNRPFTHLCIKPDPDRRAFIKVYEDDKHVQTYEMFGRPEQWQAFIKWLWNYGHDRLIRQAAIEARRKASRHHSKLQTAPHLSTRNPSRKAPTQKYPPNTALHRPLRSTSFKAQASKSRGKMKPSCLGLASLTLADLEGEAGKDQITQEKT